MVLKYDPEGLERKWQEKWASDHIYEVREDTTYLDAVSRISDRKK